MTMGIFLIGIIWAVANGLTLIFLNWDIGTTEFRLHYSNAVQVTLVMIAMILCYRTMTALDFDDPQRKV